MVKNGFLHCHTMFSLFDSAVTPDELVKRAKELGAENITLTDHGTLLGIEPFMDAGAKYKINTIPGVELYLKHREHFILFAKNYKGYQAISKTMRNADYQPAKKSKKNKDSEEGSQRYYACVPDDVLLQLKGNENIVATTACMQGPIAKILLYNFRIRKKINKIENAKKEIHPMYLDYRESDDIIKNLLVKKENLKNEEKTNKKNTSSAQAKKIRKLKKEIDSGQVSLFYDQQLREYTDKKNFYDYCVLRLKKIKEELSDIDNQIKEHRKIKKNLKSKYDRYIELDDRISSMSTQLLSEESLLQKAKDMVLYIIFTRMFTHDDVEALSFVIDDVSNGLHEEGSIRENIGDVLKGFLLTLPVLLLYGVTTLLSTYYLVNDMVGVFSKSELRAFLPDYLMLSALCSFALFFILIAFITIFPISTLGKYHLGCTFFIISVVSIIFIVIICCLPIGAFRNFFYTNFINFFFTK